MQGKRILFLILFLGLGLVGLLFVFLQQTHPQKTSRCVQIPVSFFPFPNKPLINIEIEKATYTLMLDTGSSHNLDLHKRVLAKIQDKTPMEVPRYFDIKGNSYLVHAFRSPPIKLHHHLELCGAVACEENIDFLTKGTNVRKQKSLLGKIKEQFSLFYIDGRVGWSLFDNLTCFFDLKNSSLFVAQNVEKLSEETTFNPADFIKTSLELSSCGPVLSMQTNLGTRKFLLDTGSSHSLYRESAIQLQDSIVLSIAVDEQDLGFWSFLSYPIASNLSNEFDGVLGIDFFKMHRICLDFEGKAAYLSTGTTIYRT
ncbi:MAG: hypothetical protein HY861_01630 [Chlamydiia bacterium]|nr:hypothetical protein [Chlamydiia bacterium]